MTCPSYISPTVIDAHVCHAQIVSPGCKFTGGCCGCKNILFTSLAKSQVSAALRGMAAAGIRDGEVPVCGLAKREEELHVPGQSGPLLTDPEQSAMLLLRAARDESHRFALRSHRKKRRSNIYTS